MNAYTEHLLIHTDGASRGNPGPAGAAALLYDESGACVGEILRFLGNTTNNVAEYQALLLGLIRAKEMRARSVEVVTDSELLAKQWNGEYRVKNEGLKHLYQEARDISSAFECVTLRHVRRGGNTTADEAANRAIDERVGI